MERFLLAIQDILAVMGDFFNLSINMELYQPGLTWVCLTEMSMSCTYILWKEEI